MYQMAFAFVALLALGGSAGGCAVEPQELGVDDTAESTAELVTALDVPGTFDYGTWSDTYDNRVMAGAGVLSNVAATTTTGTFTCSGTTTCPGSSGTWLYGQDTTRSRWADFSAGGQVVRWGLSETSDGRRVLRRILGSTLNRYGQRIPYGDLFLKR